MIDALYQDIRYGVRSLRKHHGFTTVVVATLAVGIAVNTAVFSLVDGVLLRALPFRLPEQLVRIWATERDAPDRLLDATFAELDAVRREARTIASIAAFSVAPRHLWDEWGEPTTLSIARISGNVFRVLGVAADRGRVLLDEELVRGDSSVLLSHRIWESRYGGDPGLIGRSIQIQGQSHLIVGVLPNWLGVPEEIEVDVWRPFFPSELEDDDGDRELQLIARLASGATPALVRSEIDTILKREKLDATVAPLHASMVRHARTPLLTLWSAVGLVLLIVAANVAGLLFARNIAREGELAIRRALGASRRRIARQLLTESLLVAMLGGIAGVLLGSWLLDLLVALSPVTAPRVMEVRLDYRALTVAGGLAAITGLAFGLFPSLDASRGRTKADLRGRAATWAGTSRERHRMQRILVVGQVALSTALLVGALLLSTSLSRRVHRDRGFDGSNALVVPVVPPTGFATGAAVVGFFETLRERLEGLPGVRAATFASTSPMEARGFRVSLDPNSWVYVKAVAPGYFRALGVPLLFGREFGLEDDENAERVAIVNRVFREAQMRSSGESGELRSDLGTARIVGVVENVVPDPSETASATVYLPFRQLPVTQMTFVMRAEGDPTAMIRSVRSLIWESDRAIPLDAITTVDETIARSVADERWMSALFVGFALVAAWLAGLGIYGVASFVTGQRRRELGLRRALGADRAELAWLILRQALALASTGIAFGLAGALLVSSFVASLLFETSPTDPVLYAAVAVFFVGVTATACYVPARRASSVDPVEAVRPD